jgi:putative ABC transport system permease protein
MRWRCWSESGGRPCRLRRRVVRRHANVARRTREMGIRMALGATPHGVTGLVMRSGLGLAAAGAIIGLVLAATSMRLVQNFLVGVSWTDPITFVGVPVLLLAVAALAAFVPARRAGRIGPLRALRAQ